MAQFHSLPVSEPVAQICGFLAGLSCYGFFSFLGADHDVCVGMAMGGSVMSNILIGGTINLSVLDLLGCVLARPLSAIAGATILAMLLSAI